MRKSIFYACLLTVISISLFSCRKDLDYNEQQVREDIQDALLQIQAVQSGDLNIQTRIAAKFVVVNSGSNNALAQALKDAGEGGIVYLRSGLHTETAGIIINSKVTLIGETGAILKVSSYASLMNLSTGVTDIYPGLHVLNAPETFIINLEIQPIDKNGSTAILYENASLSASMNCTMKQFMFSVMVEKSDKITIIGNKMIGSTLWQANPGPEAGVLIVNGKNAWIANNDIETTFAGFFLSDKGGTVVKNKVKKSHWGVVMCKIGPGSLNFPDKHKTGAASAASYWAITDNQSNENEDIGYLVIDGANNNTLEGNTATGNENYDIELAGQTSRIGFPMVPSFNNRVTAVTGQKVKDCGNNNSVTGVKLVDTTIDLCK